MGTTQSHLSGARREKENLMAVAGSEHGNMHGVVQHASLCVEHLLKAVLAAENGGHTDLTGHNLGFFLNKTDTYIPEEQVTLIYSVDGLYTASRYDDDLEADAIRDIDELIVKLGNFIGWVENIVAAKEQL